MFLLYCLFALMLASALCLLAVPFAIKGSIKSRYFFSAASFVILFSLGAYQLSGDHAALKQWLVQGKQHYYLQEQVSRLGGISGIIRQINKKLAANPEDAEGWFILGKLYLANKNYDEAKNALSKAYALRPADPQVKRYYDLAVQGAKNK